MAKTLVAQNVVGINPLTFVREGDTVVGLKCQADVNYGEMGCSHEIDVWPLMTASQRTQAQVVYNFLHAKVTQLIMG